MPYCCAVNCTNRTIDGVRLFLLPQGPKNDERRRIWLRNINRKNWTPNRAYLCEKHFAPDQFENKRADGKRLLRWNAIPTIFNYKKNTARKASKKVVDVEYCELDEDFLPSGLITLDSSPNLFDLNITNHEKWTSDHPYEYYHIEYDKQDSFNTKDDCYLTNEDCYLRNQESLFPSTMPALNPEEVRIKELQKQLKQANDRIKHLEDTVKTIVSQMSTVVSQEQMDQIVRRLNDNNTS